MIHAGAHLDDREFDALLERHCDGTLSPGPEAERLSAELRRSGQRRREFYEYHQLHAELRWIESASHRAGHADLAELPDAAPVRSPPESREPVPPFRSRVRQALETHTALSLSIASLVMLSILLLLAATTLRPLEPSRESSPAPPPLVARLVALDASAREASQTDLPRVGTDLEVGRTLRLESGQATLRFEHGARLELFGPAELRIVSASTVRMLKGRCFVRVEPRGGGFAVQTELVDALDLGTEFSVLLHAGIGGELSEVEVAVYSGQVEATPSFTAKDRALVLSEGEVARFRRAGHELTQLEQSSLREHRSRFIPQPSGVLTAYAVPRGTVGNQEFDGALGMDFQVARSIVVTHLGVFDSGQDGLQRPITARLYERPAGASPRLLASLEFIDRNGALLGGSRFLPLESAELAEGFHGRLPSGFRGTIVAEGYGPREPNGNSSIPGLAAWMTNHGAGRLQFVGSGRFGPAGSFPQTVDRGPPNQYAAGTFRFLPDESVGSDPPPKLE